MSPLNLRLPNGTYATMTTSKTSEDETTLSNSTTAMSLNGDSSSSSTSSSKTDDSSEESPRLAAAISANIMDEEGAQLVSGTIGDIMSRTRLSGTISPANGTTTSKRSISSSTDTTQRQEEPNRFLLPKDGLVTTSQYGLAKAFGIVHPLDRMAVTANGNLQRLFSSYYDAPVFVVVDYCRPSSLPTSTTTSTATTGTTKIWDRRVHLMVHNTTFCTATTQIHVHDVHCQELVESGQVGIGQLYRYLDVLPEFELHDAGYYYYHQSDPSSSDDLEDSDVILVNGGDKNKNGKQQEETEEEEPGLWRKYTLSCPKYVTCHIHETFIPGAWNL